MNGKREPLWSGRGANPPFYSTQSPHDTSSSAKNKMSSSTLNQNEKYPNSHVTSRDPRPRKTRQRVWPDAPAKGLDPRW